MEDTDRCGRGGGDAGCAVVSAGRLAVSLRGRVQGHGVLGDPALPGVVLCRERVRRRKLCGYAVLWGRRVLGRGVRLGHRFRGVGGLLATLQTGEQQSLVSVGARSSAGGHVLQTQRVREAAASRRISAHIRGTLDQR